MNYNNANSISVWRIVFTYMIALLHFGIAPSYGWKICVEFFFLLSGLLLGYEYDKCKYASAFSYIKSRYKRLYPHYIFSFCIFILITSIYSIHNSDFNLVMKLTELKHSILEIFMLQILGIGGYAQNHGAVWYLSSLIVNSFFIFLIINKSKKYYLKFVGPALIILSFLLMLTNYGDIALVSYETRYGIILIPGLLRGLGEMNIGCLSYFIGKYLYKMNVFNTYKKIALFIECGLFLSVCLYSFFSLDHTLLIIAALNMGITISFFTPHNNLLNCNFVNWLSKLTYPIYLNHPLFVNCLLLNLLDRKNTLVIIFYVLIITVYSYLTNYVVTKITCRLAN